MVLKILQWNLNGYQNNFYELKILQNNNCPHISLLHETHLKENPSDSLIINNYSFFAKHSSASKHGVALMIARNLLHKPVELNANGKCIEQDIKPIELQASLASLQGKTPGYDNITYPMLENVPIFEKSKLCQLYNKSLHSRVIPHQWKKAIIVPIIK